MPEVHALLSASSSKQWLHCPPSIRLQEGYPNESSTYAKEGTFAHSVCEYKIRRYLQEDVTRPESEKYDSEEIEEITDVYAEFVITVIETMKRNGCEPLVMVEERVDYSHIAPDGFGTADMLIIGKDEKGRGLLHIVDFKAGAGVFVDVDHNSQLSLYALGGLHAYGFLYPIEVIRMTIVQPRLENIDTFECSREELEAWGEEIKPIAKLAYEGKGEQHPGDWCRFCRAKPVCRACAEEALALAREEFLDLDAQFDTSGTCVGEATDATGDEENTGGNEDLGRAPVFKQPGLIPLAELITVLPSLGRISAWIEAVFAFVTSEAINHGVPIPGYKVVEGRSKRIFTDTDAVVETAVQNGYTNLYKQQLKTLTEFEKMMGKKRFHELLGDYVAKAPGKLALVPDSDPRPAVEPTVTAGMEFDEILE